MTGDTAANRRMKQIEKVVLGVVAGAAAAIGIVDIVALTMRVIALATDEAIVVNGIPLMDFPAEQISEASAQVTSAAFETLTLTATGLSGSTRGLLITASILTALVAIGICAVVAWLCVRVLVGRPFVRSATWGIGIVAILVVTGGLLGPLFESIAHAEIVMTLDITVLPAFLAVLDLSPLGWGMALAVVAGAFEIGQRMQQDTKGLV
ncbi:hypothetical protein [Microbacterium sp. A93]|uniref:hypothetical protein n=1 Tax=Microbacterium sp. A93 TaxID=3450716 RepID=UPI003F41F39E